MILRGLLALAKTALVLSIVVSIGMAAAWIVVAFFGLLEPNL